MKYSLHFKALFNFSFGNHTSIVDKYGCVITVIYNHWNICIFIWYLLVLSCFLFNYLIIYLQIYFVLLIFIDILIGANWFNEWMYKPMITLKVLPKKLLFWLEKVFFWYYVSLKQPILIFPVKLEFKIAPFYASFLWLGLDTIMFFLLFLAETRLFQRRIF